MDEFGMCLAFPNEGSEEPRWTPTEEEMGIEDAYWVALLTFLFMGGFPIPVGEEFSMERVTAVIRYVKENQSQKAKELMDFMKDEIAEMVSEAWQATNGK